MDTIVPLTEVRAHLPSFIKSLKKGGIRRRVLITRNGRPSAVLLSPEELESLEILADKDLMLSLLRAEKEVRPGRLLRHDEVFH